MTAYHAQAAIAAVHAGATETRARSMAPHPLALRRSDGAQSLAGHSAESRRGAVARRRAGGGACGARRRSKTSRRSPTTTCCRRSPAACSPSSATASGAIACYERALERPVQRTRAPLSASTAPDGTPGTDRRSDPGLTTVRTTRRLRGMNGTPAGRAQRRNYTAELAV